MYIVNAVTACCARNVSCFYTERSVDDGTVVSWVYDMTHMG